MKQIFLNWSPPAYIELPSPALSILKTYLERNTYKCKIVYWNVILYDLQKKFLKKNRNLSSDKDPLLLFLNYIALESKDRVLLDSVKAGLYANIPEYMIKGSTSYDEYMVSFKRDLDEILESVIEQECFKDALYFGFSLKFEQWVFAYLLAKKLKSKFPSIPIVVGGITSKKAAEAFLQNFKEYDFAIWGEGEESLLELSNRLSGSYKDFSNIPRLAYRDNSYIKFSKIQGEYVNLSTQEFVPDFHDFIHIKDKYKITNYALSVEFSRGCHWNKCHFCYLNEGYKYRRKSIDKINNELLNLIQTYNCYRYSTTDNDLVGGDLEYFDKLLDVLIGIKNRYPDFSIVVAEVITKGLSQQIIKKMSYAGLHNIQIGYENTSDNLLRKIQKSNTFASNILFVKFASLYKIKLTGLNVIYNLFEETDNDVIEAVLNLKFLRFYRAYMGLNHRLTPLTINTQSKYYKKYSESIIKDEWAPINTTTFHMREYWRNNSGWYILDYAKPSRNYLWLYFEEIDYYYISNKYRYSAKCKPEGIIITEYCNENIINVYTIENDSVDYQLFKYCNNEVVSLDYINRNVDFSCEEMRLKLDFYFEKGLIYHNSNYTEIVSIINVDIFNL